MGGAKLSQVRVFSLSRETWHTGQEDSSACASAYNLQKVSTSCSETAAFFPAMFVASGCSGIIGLLQAGDLQAVALAPSSLLKVLCS
jgi:hypothetical protein